MKPSWYVVRVRSRSEERVSSVLNQKNVETLLPCWEERRTYSDRIRRLLVPAFSGYVFCRIELAERLRVLDTPGVQYLVGATGPEAIQDDVIAGLQKTFSRPDQVFPVEYVKAGDTVRVLDGPLTGVTGMLLRTKGTHRLIISVDALRRSVAVEVDAASTTAYLPLSA